MKPQSRKAKGSRYETEIARKILLSGVCSRSERNRDSGAGNQSKSDILTDMQICGNNTLIECKHQKKIQLAAWWRQAKEAAYAGQEEPLLVFKIHGTSQDLVTLSFDTFLEMLQRQGEKQPELDKKVERLLEKEAERNERLAKLKAWKNRKSKPIEY